MQDKDEDNYIEYEQGNESIASDVPFNPNDINVSIIPRTVGQLIEMLEYDEILIPKFQRLPNLWNIKKKSRFIESLMLNLPIPLFYFDEGEDKKWRVIDGLQRISTLEHFVLGGVKDNLLSENTGSFALSDLEFRTEFNGKTWEELPRDVQRRISTNQITINLIGKGTPNQVKYNIFSRINQGGIELHAQEIRTALFQGYRTDFLEKLVSRKTLAGQSFWKAVDNSIPILRQQDLDFATRFLSFYLIDYREYEPDMDSFLTRGTKEIPLEINLQNDIISAFTRGMNLAYSIFEHDAFRKRINNSDKRKPINKPLFEIISVSFAKCSPIEIENLKHNKSSFLKGFKELQKADKFWSAITTGTASRDRVRQRHIDFNNLINLYK